MSVIRLTNGRRNGARSNHWRVRKGFGPASIDDPMERYGHSIARMILLSRLQFLIGRSGYRTCPEHGPRHVGFAAHRRGGVPGPVRNDVEAFKSILTDCQSFGAAGSASLCLTAFSNRRTF